jgi:DNA-binding transcriptional ArsR family regulator
MNGEGVMSEKEYASSAEESEVLADGAPVVMPVLPIELLVESAEQFKALGEPVRWRILGVIQHRAATAKQIATILQMAPGTIGHHLQVLEGAGLVQVVARRQTHGIIAKYYTRTARIFKFAFASEVTGSTSISLDIVTKGREDLLEMLSQQERGEDEEEMVCAAGLPRARLSPARLVYYRQRLNALIDEMLHEPEDASGEVFDLLVALFKAPAYVQGDGDEHRNRADEQDI